MVDNVLKSYAAKKKELEKYKLSLDLPSLDAQINCFKYKEAETSSTEKVKTIVYIYSISDDTNNKSNTHNV